MSVVYARFLYEVNVRVEKLNLTRSCALLLCKVKFRSYKVNYCNLEKDSTSKMQML